MGAILVFPALGDRVGRPAHIRNGGILPAEVLTSRVPVIYKVNLREATGYFHAQHFRMRDKDLIFVANADGAQLLKFFALLRGGTVLISDLTATSTKLGL